MNCGFTGLICNVEYVACLLCRPIILLFTGGFKMEQNTNKIQRHEDTKKLSFVVLFLGLFVVALFGLAH